MSYGFLIMNDQDKLKEILISMGYTVKFNPLNVEHNECDWYAYRAFPSTRKCECNEKKDIQIVIYPYQYSKRGIYGQSVEIDLTGQFNGVWWKLQSYSISMDEVKDKHDSIVKSLISAWEHL
jgi:hypothetical protein